MSSGEPMTNHSAGQREPSAPSCGSVEENADVRDSRTANTTDHDAVPAATAPVDRLVRLGATDRENVGTDKAEPLTRDCGTGNTNARLEALEELSALDQKLELEYGLTGNPLIKAGRHTPPPQTTPGECSKPREGTSEPVAWWLRGAEYDTGCEYEYVSLLKENAEAAAAEGGTVVPLYRSPTLTDAEREALHHVVGDVADITGPVEDTLRGLLERTR